MNSDQFQAGRARLAQPVLPLVRLLELLFLSGPFATVGEVVAELNEPIDTVVHYETPAEALEPYMDLMAEFERLKDPSPAAYTVLDRPDGEPLPLFEAVDGWVAQQVLSRELEAINSLLCGPCRCTLCCVGPEAGMRQNFFEIPLQAEEIGLFPLPRVDSADSRGLAAASEPGLSLHGRPFHEQEGPGLYHWQNGWSLILPRAAACPQLQATGACGIYPERPAVCRRPQIFAYLLEPSPTPGHHVRQNKILAVWDCPYVRALQAEIAAYAECCELEPIFKENKA